MKKSTRSKKTLKLSTETVRNLDSKSLQLIVGGLYTNTNSYGCSTTSDNC